MIKKLKGMQKEPVEHISKENRFAETEKQVANEIALTFSKNSSTENYSKELKKCKQISGKKNS